MTEKLNKSEHKDMTGRHNDQLRHAEVRRFLNRMPLFRPDERRSTRFDDLLAALEAAETQNRH